jgi:transposase
MTADRQHHGRSAPLDGRRKRGPQAQAIGRSRGGWTTKIHATVDDRGRPLTFALSAGQRHDLPFAPALSQTLSAAKLCAADAAYDSDAFRRILLTRGTCQPSAAHPLLSLRSSRLSPAQSNRARLLLPQGLTPASLPVTAAPGRH